MTLSQQISDDVSSVFINTDDFAVTVSYVRGTTTVASNVAALVSETTFETATDFGFTRYETRDFLFVASALSIEPRKADVIVEGTKRYTVTAPQSGAEWRYEDENRRIIRVHCVLSKS